MPRAAKPCRALDKVRLRQERAKLRLLEIQRERAEQERSRRIAAADRQRARKKEQAVLEAYIRAGGGVS